MSRLLIAMFRLRTPPGKRRDRDALVADPVRSAGSGDVPGGNGARRDRRLPLRFTSSWAARAGQQPARPDPARLPRGAAATGG